jgi:hypothetical protein
MNVGFQYGRPGLSVGSGILDGARNLVKIFSQDR